MNNWKTLFGIVLALCVLATPALLAPQQTGARVTAQLDTGVVKLGSTVSCTVQVDGAATATLDSIPTIEGMPLVRKGSPSYHHYRSVINRQVTQRRTISWTVQFRPSRVDEFVIPPMRLTVDGKEAFTHELTLTVVADMKGQDLGHLVFIGVPERVYEGQPFTVRMEFGWDLQLNPMVTLANLILPWWNELPGTLEIDGGASSLSVQAAEVSVNSRARVRATELGSQKVDGRDFRVLRVTRTFVATRAGSLDFPQSWLEFGKVNRGFLTRETREVYHVGAPGFSIEVRPLPTEGQPFDFSKGVGHFEAKAEVNRRDVDVGESIRLTVDWTGEANLKFFELPAPSRLEAFDGFRSYGSTNDRFYGDRRRVVYDLAPLSPEIHEIPPVPLVVFDPELEEYTVVTTPAIPIRVRALEGAVGLSGEGDDDGSALFTHDIQTQPERGDEGSGPGGGTVFGAWGSLTALWLVSRTIVRRRGDPDAPAARRRRGARRKLSRELRRAKSAGVQSQTLFEFLGARSGEAPEAWEGRDVSTWLVARDLDLESEAARELIVLTGELDRRHWAEDDAPLEESRVTAVADRLLKEGF